MPFFSISLRKLIIVVLACLLGLYLVSFSDYFNNGQSGSWVDSIDHGELPQKSAAEADDKLAVGPTASDYYNATTNYQRRQAVREATKHAWAAYKKFAWGKDEYRPLTKGSNLRWGDWAITLVDSLDTLKLVGLETEYKEAKQFVGTMRFDRTSRGYKTQFFEMTIRALGGLLGAYELDNDPMLLKQAKQVGDSLAYAFKTKTGLPTTRVDINRKSPVPTDAICIAEAGTLQLEFKKLSQLTGDDKYAKLVENVSDILEAAEKKHKGLYPLYINIQTGKYDQTSSYTIGGKADSFYEYLLKQYILHDGKEPKFKERYVTSVEAIKDKLLKKSSSGFSYIGELASNEKDFVHQMSHLACFYPGLLALGSKALDRPQDLELAKELARTCYYTYRMTPTGLGPERFVFKSEKNQKLRNMLTWWLTKWFAPVYEFDANGIGSANTQYYLRPETIETMFILYRVTGDTKYQEWGWNMFKAIEKYTKLEFGYAGIKDVYSTSTLFNRLNSMESFFLAETLKYLYLLFSPTDLLPLNEYVLNTEAHPLRIMKSK
ncbi:hypothetical protein H4R26_001002 [Coemansia thaxteri]|uniref:alpha-1,2-Mannosidase n=1 Tax=Coemansia thaxteri TaxID=2663907 RepID=A0A9W8EH12_9FUNG|nr:hypothetical protein H4R26_001002 [Coemansia thaxteri]